MHKILKKIKTECSDYLEQSDFYPAVKAFMDRGQYFRKVKVRHKKNAIGFIRVVGDALQNEHQNIHIRSVVANGPHGTAPGMKTHYIFPKNGYKFLFNSRVNFHEEYKNSYLKLLGLDVPNNKALEIVEKSIECAYATDKTSLRTALKSGKEIIFYNIAYYYTVSSEKYPHYDELIELLKK